MESQHGTSAQHAVAARLMFGSCEYEFSSVWKVKGKYVSFVFGTALRQLPNVMQHFRNEEMKSTTTMLTIKELTILAIVSVMLISCTPSHENTDQTQRSSYSLPFTTNIDSLPELTAEQQCSFDALNTLQVSTDEKNHLYSTFANIVQPCYPPDTSITISRSSFLTAMEQFVAKHCTALTIAKRKELVSTAVLAQEEYIVLHCPDHSSEVNYETGLPMTGTWVIPSVLGRRDIVLIW